MKEDLDRKEGAVPPGIEIPGIPAQKMVKRDRKLLMQLGMTEEQVERDAARVESETESDNLTGRVYYGLHLEPNHEDKVTVSLRIPRATLKRLDAQAKRYHLNRSEYIRRRLAEI